MYKTYNIAYKILTDCLQDKSWPQVAGLFKPLSTWCSDIKYSDIMLKITRLYIMMEF